MSVTPATAKLCCRYATARGLEIGAGREEHTKLDPASVDAVADLPGTAACLHVHDPHRPCFSTSQTSRKPDWLRRVWLHSVDDRRRRVGLEPLDDYLGRFEQRCSQAHRREDQATM
jgi:hypothetical protein